MSAERKTEERDEGVPFHDSATIAEAFYRDYERERGSG